MSSILEYVDEISKDVITQIVSTYEEDIFKYKDNSDFQAIGIGTELNSILKHMCDCLIKQSETDKGFVLIFERANPNFPTIKQRISYCYNNGIIRRTRAIQIINFIKRLSDEGLILFADATEYKCYPIFKGMSYEEENSMVFPVQNKRLNHFIKAIYYSHIFPSETLLGFVQNEFKTTEQIRFEKQKELSEKSLHAALNSNRISLRSVEIAKDANIIAQKSLLSSEKSNHIALGVAVAAMIITVIMGLLPSSLTNSTIHDIGREIMITTQKYTSPHIIFNNFQEKDSIQNGKTHNEKL